MSKLRTIKQAVSQIRSGSSILVGGFYSVGTPENVIEEIINQNIKDLTIITNDTGTENNGVQRLIESGCVKKLIVTYIGLTPNTQTKYEKGELELEITPQGTLIEQIRCGGFGLGGVLTPTGLGTSIENDTQVFELNGKSWLYHSPIRADFAIVEAHKGDIFGNLVFRRTQNNFCTMMCFAADLVIASIVEPILDIGAIDPDHVMVPGIVVDLIVRKGV